MHPDLKKFLFLGGAILIISGGLLAWRFGWVPQIGKFFAAESNRAPSVSLKSSGGCTANCTAFFEATAVDYDGDPLSYTWSGCASGSGNRAQCSITGSATIVSATVSVSDGRGGQTSATITAHAAGMKTIADFSSKYILFNGHFSTPNGSTVVLGYAVLSAGGTAEMYYLKTVVGDYSDTVKKHNPMRLTPGIFPPNYDPNCQPGFIKAGNFRMVRRTGSWSYNGTSLQIYVPEIEYSTGPPEVPVGFTFSWAPEQGSQTESLILRSVVGDNEPSPWYAGGVYGYAYLSSQSPYSSSQLTAAQFSENYWGLSATRLGFGQSADWTQMSPELTDAYMISIGGFFPYIPAFFTPPLALGYYSNADPNVWSRTILLVEDPRSIYGNHTWLFNYSDDARPALSHTLMYWHGGHDFSDNGCYDPVSDSGGHILTSLGVLENGEVTKIVAIETGSEYGKLVLDRWFRVAYPIVTAGPPPPAPDQAPTGFNDGPTYTEIPTEGGGIIPANSIFGWAFDPDASTQSIAVHLYFDGEPGACPDATCVVRAVTADTIRGDVNQVYNITGNHGFTFDITQLPARFLDGRSHTVSAYAINIPPQGQTGTAANVHIGTKTFNLVAPMPTPTPPPGCYYQQVDCFTTPCDPILVCPSTTPTGTVPGDANGDGKVNILDFNLVVSHFGQTGSSISGDVNHDDKVNILDFNAVVSHFGQ